MKNIAKWIAMASMVAGAAYLIVRWGMGVKCCKQGCDDTVLTPEMVDEMTCNDCEGENE